MVTPRLIIARFVWWLMEPAMIERANEEMQRQNEERAAAQAAAMAAYTQATLNELARRYGVNTNGFMGCAWPLDRNGQPVDKTKLN